MWFLSNILTSMTFWVWEMLSLKRRKNKPVHKKCVLENNSNNNYSYLCKWIIKMHSRTLTYTLVERYTTSIKGVFHMGIVFLCLQNKCKVLIKVSRINRATFFHSLYQIMFLSKILWRSLRSSCSKKDSQIKGRIQK